MPKLSISLPDGLIESVQKRYPNVPFSKALALIIQEKINSGDTGSINPTNATIPTGSINTTPSDLSSIVRTIIQEEISKISPMIVETQEKTELTVIPPPEIVNAPNVAHQDEWLTNGEVVKMLPDSIPFSTRVGKVSKAVSKGILKSNGKHRIEGRIDKHSAEAWVASFA